MEHSRQVSRAFSIPLWFGIFSIVSSCGFGFILKVRSIESLVVFICGSVIGTLGFIFVKQIPQEEKQRQLVKVGRILSIVGTIVGVVMCVMWLIENI